MAERIESAVDCCEVQALALFNLEVQALGIGSLKNTIFGAGINLGFQAYLIVFEMREELWEQQFRWQFAGTFPRVRRLRDGASPTAKGL